MNEKTFNINCHFDARCAGGNILGVRILKVVLAVMLFIYSLTSLGQSILDAESFVNTHSGTLKFIALIMGIVICISLISEKHSFPEIARVLTAKLKQQNIPIEIHIPEMPSREEFRTIEKRLNALEERPISLESAQKAVSEAKNLSGKKLRIQYSPDGESPQYAESIGEIFKLAGLEVEIVQGDEPENDGILIGGPDPRTVSTTTSAVQTFDRSARRSPFTGAFNTDVIMYVGKKPKKDRNA